MKITRFEDVEAWKAARALVNEAYRVTRSGSFLPERDLVRQVRRASVSAISNIAEGFDAGMDGEFKRFLRIARRSASEVQSHLYVALDQAPLAKDEFEKDLQAGRRRKTAGRRLSPVI